jgi:hypothetical protein
VKLTKNYQRQFTVWRKCISRNPSFSNASYGRKDLSGLPEGTIETARSLAKSQEKEGWILL